MCRHTQVDEYTYEHVQQPGVLIFFWFHKCTSLQTSTFELIMSPGHLCESVKVDLSPHVLSRMGRRWDGRKEEGGQTAWVLRDRVVELSAADAQCLQGRESSPADIRGTLSFKTGDHHLTFNRTMTSPRSCGTGPPSVMGWGHPAEA